MKSWFISDLHITDMNERNGQILLRFLFHLNLDPKNNELYLLGDIFDFWLSDGRAFRSRYKLFIEAIKKFKAAGGGVHYFEGNHDFHVDVFWTKKLDIPVTENFFLTNVGSYRVRLEHGDLINPQDQAYLNYRAKVRRPWVEWIGHQLPGFFLQWLGETMSRRSRKRSKYYTRQNESEIREMVRTHAKYIYADSPFDLIITGHMHVEDDFTFEMKGRTVRSINLGTWLNRPIALLVEGARIEWVPLGEENHSIKT